MERAHEETLKATAVEPPVYGRKRHPWRWGVAHTRRIGDEMRTWITGEHDSREHAEREMAKRVEWHERENVANPAIDDRILEPTEDAPVFRSIDAAIEAAPLKPVSLYEWECPLCGTTLGEYHGDYSAMEAGEAHSLYQEHLHEHGLPCADDLATCLHCAEEFDISDMKRVCPKSGVEGCETND